MVYGILHDVDSYLEFGCFTNWYFMDCRSLKLVGIIYWRVTLQKITS